MKRNIGNGLLKQGLIVRCYLEKQKRALVRHFDEIAEEYERADDYVLRDLPICKACEGTGESDPYDIGWSLENCLICSGTGKIGWRYDDQGNKTPIKNFFKIKI